MRVLNIFCDNGMSLYRSNGSFHISPNLEANSSFLNLALLRDTAVKENLEEKVWDLLIEVCSMASPRTYISLPFSPFRP